MQIIRLAAVSIGMVSVGLILAIIGGRLALYAYRSVPGGDLTLFEWIIHFTKVTAILGGLMATAGIFVLSFGVGIFLFVVYWISPLSHSLRSK
jgi:hypothetical protein